MLHEYLIITEKVNISRNIKYIYNLIYYYYYLLLGNIINEAI